jgi:hypothetical protein
MGDRYLGTGDRDVCGHDRHSRSGRWTVKQIHLPLSGGTTYGPFGDRESDAPRRTGRRGRELTYGERFRKDRKFGSRREGFTNV